MTGLFIKEASEIMLLYSPSALEGHLSLQIHNNLFSAEQDWH